MSDPKQPKPSLGSTHSEPRRTSSDAEADALLDSLLFDDLPGAGAASETERPIKLHEPAKRDYSEDDVTVVGRADELFARLASHDDDGTSGLEELASSDIDQLLSSLPAGAPGFASEPVGPLAVPPLPAVPPAPRLPFVPRPAALVSTAPRAYFAGTAKPPAVNPAGLPPRPPFPPAVSPHAPVVRAPADRSRGTSPGPEAEFPALGSTAPPSPFVDQDDDERTRIFLASPNSPSIEPADLDMLADPFATPPAASANLHSGIPTQKQPEAAERFELFATPEPDPVAPSLPPPYGANADGDQVGEFELWSETPEPLPPEAPETDGAAEPVASVPPQASVPPSIWPDERPAHHHLGTQHEAWTTRAEWLENEARQTNEPQAKARLSIVASELWALVGDLPRARRLASEASSVPRAPAVAARQLRSLAAADGDYKAVLPALELEIRSAGTIEARVHAAYLSAEVHRLVLRDELNSKKKLDLAVRADPDDPRAHVGRLAELLGKSNAPPKLRFAESEALHELVRATEAVSTLRGAPRSGIVSESPRALFEDARQALNSGNREQAADQLLLLAGFPGFEQASHWLASQLLTADSKTRPRALPTLRELERSTGSRLARRALVGLALARSDSQSVHEAIGSTASEAAFTAADRLALAALSDYPQRDLDAIAEVAHDPELRPLAAAFVSAHASDGLEVWVGPPGARAEQRLGHALACPPNDASGLSYLRADAESFENTHPESALASLLALEFARADQDKPQIASRLAQWHAAGTVEPELERDQRLAAALVHELAGEQGSASVMYQRALELDPSCEAAVRALSGGAEEKAAQLFERLAEELGPSTRAALTLLEAHLRAPSSDEVRRTSLLERAAGADPEFALSHRLLELDARRRQDRPALLAAIRGRREGAEDPLEQAHDQVREATLVAAEDPALAERLLDEALRARPNDLALRALQERLIPSDPERKAAWREALADSQGDALSERLLIVAAFERARAGDYESATRDAGRAADVANNPLWRVTAERYAKRGGAPLAHLSKALLEQARASEESEEQRRLYQRLSALDRARGEASSAILWQTAILEHSPEDLPALRHLEQAYIGGDRDEELEPIAETLARVLGEGESTAHARFAARLRVRRGAWADTRELADIANQRSPNDLWALRSLSAHARVAEDPELSLRVQERLLSLIDRPLDQASLALRAAEACLALQRPADAKRFLAVALEHVPGHFVALGALAETLEAEEDYAAAAEVLETAARASRVEAHQLSAWHQAAVLWLDKALNPARGQSALEQAALLDIRHEDSVVRLQSLYVAAGERQKLAELLQRRLERTTDPEERIAIEVTRGRALADVGERDAAKAALAAALDANPDHAEALQAFAELCLEEGDWTSGEQALIRLARHVNELPRQAQLYRRLGELYDTALPNPERAELAYKEVLKREPGDADTVARLVQVYGRLGDPERALQLQAEAVAQAKTPEQKRDQLLALSLVEEQIAGDRKRAEGSLEKARKEWPHDSLVLRALAEFQVRNGESRAAQVLLDRAATDARRALSTGRFEPAFFEVLATVAELKNAGDSALLARATLAALHGEELAVPAAGPIAGDPKLDELMAPELVSPPLRALLLKTGPVLDAAYAVDLRTLRAAPLPVASAAFTSYVQQVALSFGLRAVEMFASPNLGPVCLPVSSSPPQIVFGQALLDSQDDAARYFLLIRCLKILQGNAAALSRTAPVELWPVLAGYLSVLAPNWLPQGVDPKKLGEAQRRIQAQLPSKLDDDVPVLALEVIGAIGNRASLLGTSLHQWGNRTALLSAGSLVASLRGVALSSGLTAGPPENGPERVKWIVRNPEARDLATFSVSEQYTEARTRLGLSR